VTIARNEKERICIEPSINSVRVSILIKQVSSFVNLRCGLRGNHCSQSMLPSLEGYYIYA
jgi:hypothetical protein